MKLHSKAQVTVELTLALLACVIFLIGVVKVFVWFNQCIVERQEAFQKSRTQALRFSAGSGYDKYEANNDFYHPKKLDLLR
jgi:hypothetical protein